MTRSPEKARPFQLFGGHVALDLVNTLDNRFHPDGLLDLLPTFDRLLAFCEQAGVITAADARRLRHKTGDGEAERAVEEAVALREALNGMFSAVVQRSDPPADAISTLNHALGEPQQVRTLEWERPNFVWRAQDVAERPMAPLWLIAQAAAALLTSDDIVHVRECGSETCRWFFLDRSRNHSRRWCDMKTCGNRWKASQFHARHHRGSARAQSNRP